MSAPSLSELKWTQDDAQYDYASTDLWGHQGPRYEYPSQLLADSVGLAPRDEVLERMLFAIDERPSKGINFSKYDGIHVDLEIPEDNGFEPIKSFEDANLHLAMQANIRLCGYKEPTPIQAYSIPCLLNGNDLLAGAQTGNSNTTPSMLP